MEEANHALSQAVRLGLADPSLLREIGNCYVATGLLDAAEEAFRLSLAVEMKNTAGGASGGAGEGPVSGNPHTRRRLADVLSARNASSQVLCGQPSCLRFACTYWTSSTVTCHAFTRNGCTLAAHVLARPVCYPQCTKTRKKAVLVRFISVRESGIYHHIYVMCVA